MKPTPWLIAIIAVLLLCNVLQWQCNSNKVAGLSNAVAISNHEKDSVNALQAIALDSNNRLNARLWDFTKTTNKQLDSLRKALDSVKGDLKAQNIHAKNLVKTLHDYGLEKKDSIIQALADSLESLRAAAANNITDAFNAYDGIDTTWMKQHREDSVALASKDKTIAEVKAASDRKDKIIEGLQEALNKAIKSKNRKTILEVAKDIGLFLAGAFLVNQIK